MSEEEIIQETYGLGQETVDNKHIEEKSRSLKRNRVSSALDKDSNMTENNTSSSSSNSKETPQAPTADSNKEGKTSSNETLDSSIHKPSQKSLKGKERMLCNNNQQDHQKTQTKNTTDDQTKIPEDLILNSEDEFKNYRGAESYDLFTLLTYDQSKNRDNTKDNLKKY